MVLIALAMLSGTASALDCPVSPDALDEVLDEAVAAYAALDSSAFGVARDEARVAVGCLSGPLTAAQAGAYHRMEGLNGLLSRDERRMLDAFRASVAVDPYWEMPESLAPEGHPLRQAYDQARESPPASTVTVRTPSCTLLVVDGVQTPVRPRDRPAILQLLAEVDDAVLWSGYLPSGVEPPGWMSLEGVASLECDEPVVNNVDRKDTLSRLMLYGAGGAALVSGGLLAGSLVGEKNFEAREYTSEAQGETLRGRVTTAFVGSQVGVGVAVGLAGTGLLLRMEW